MLKSFKNLSTITVKYENNNSRHLLIDVLEVTQMPGGNDSLKMGITTCSTACLHLRNDNS